MAVKNKKKVDPSSPNQEFALDAIQHGFSVANRRIYLFGTVTTRKAAKIIIALHEMNKIQKPITVTLCSPGGSESAGLALYDAFRQSKSRIHIEAFGECMSIAPLILQAGDKRSVSRECRLMFHLGSASISNRIHATELAALGKEQERSNERYIQLLASRSNVKVAKVTEWANKETYLTAKEAVFFGFADEVLDADPITEQSPTTLKEFK